LGNINIFVILGTAMEKRGQAAIEFIMTYGWAFLVVLVAVAALAAFGVLDSSLFLPNKCILEAGIGCDDFRINENSVSLSLRNSRGEDVTITSISFEGCSGSPSGILSNHDQSLFIIDGCNNTLGEKFNKDFTLTYTGRSGLQHEDKGMVSGKVELGTSSGSSNWYSSAWQFRKKITISKDNIDEDVSNFPVLLSITDADLKSNAQADGDDILFAQGLAKWDHEIEEYDSSTGILVAWIRAPHLPSASDEVFYMYYGNPNSSNQQNAGGVWSSYQSVWHMSQDPSSAIDDSAGANDGTALGSMDSSDQVPGIIGGSLDFDGNDDRVEVQSPSGLNPGAITVETWIKPASSDCQAIVSLFRSSGDNRAWDISHSCHENGKAYFEVSDDGSSAGKNYSIGQTSLSGGSWSHLVGVYTGTQLIFYLNGVVDTNPGNNPLPYSDGIASVTADFNIGAIDNPLNFFTGTIDEVRVSGGAKSSAWIKTSYANQNSPQTFHTIGVQETKPE